MFFVVYVLNVRDDIIIWFVAKLVFFQLVVNKIYSLRIEEEELTVTKIKNVRLIFILSFLWYLKKVI